MHRVGYLGASLCPSVSETPQRKTSFIPRANACPKLRLPEAAEISREKENLSARGTPIAARSQFLQTYTYLSTVTSERGHSERQKMPFPGQLMGQHKEWIVKNCINAQAIQPILQPVILPSSLWTSSTMSLSCLTEFPAYGNQMKESTRTPAAVTVEKQLVQKEIMDLPSHKPELPDQHLLSQPVVTLDWIQSPSQGLDWSPISIIAGKKSMMEADPAYSSPPHITLGLATVEVKTCHVASFFAL